MLVTSRHVDATRVMAREHGADASRPENKCVWTRLHAAASLNSHVGSTHVLVKEFRANSGAKEEGVAGEERRSRSPSSSHFKGFFSR